MRLNVYVAILAGIISVIAGGYMLTSQSAASESTVFDVIMHGVGAYLIARGLWMLATAKSATDIDD